MKLPNLDLKNLDINDFSSWPLPFKWAASALACLLILFAGYWFIIKGKMEQLDGARKKEDELRATFMQKKAMAINLPAYKQQMEEMEQSFGVLLRQLPDKTEIPELLIDITQAGLGRGLQFVLFKPEAKRPVEFYAELPISLQVIGTYHELGEFVSDLSALSRIVTLGNITIAPLKGSRLSMSATAKTYHYLDEDEINAGKAPAKGPAAAPKAAPKK